MSVRRWMGLLALWLGAAAGVSAASLDQLLGQLREQDLLRASYAVQQGDTLTLTGRIDAGPPDEAYRIGSVSKLFTAVLVLQLVDEGQLALDTPVARYFPAIDPAVTVEQLLRHRGGLGDFTAAPDFEAWARQPRSMAELRERLEQAPREFPAGTRARYSNAGFILLHWLVEAASGQRFEERLRDKITGPLGLTHTRFAQAGEGLGSFGRDGQRWRAVPATHPSVPQGAGALVSTPSELTRFIRALFRGQLLSPARLAAMTTLVDGFGQGIYHLPHQGQWAEQGWGHEGVIDGFRASLIYLPERDLAVAVLANAEQWPRDELVQALLTQQLAPGRELPDLRPQLQRWVLQLRATPLPAGQHLALRGSAPPLSWERGLPFGADGRLSLDWRSVAGLPLEAKLVVEDARGQVQRWERGENRRWLAGAPPGPLRFNVKGEQEALWREVEAADTEAFAAFNARDAATLSRFFSPRLEFFHDLDGLTDKTRSMSQLSQNFARPDMRLRRELLQEGLAIYPLPGIGAMQIGRHAFCRQDRGASGEFGPEQCQVLGFSAVWEKVDGQWRMLRVLSYEH